MKVLVSGAGGFVGRALCRALVETGYRVYGTCRSENGDLLPGVVKVVWSGGDLGLKAISQIDAVVHLAARVHVMRESAVDPLTDFRIANVDITRDLAKWAAAHGVKRFVFLSTIKVNGELSLPGRPFRPDDAPAPEDAYGISKLEAELALQKACADTGMEFVVIRPPLVYGPGVGGNFRTLLRWMQRGAPLPLGAIDNRRSLVALDNLIDLITVCLMHPAAANQVFLAADGEDVSTTELLLKIAQAYGRSARLLPVPSSWLRACAAVLGRRAAADRLLGSLVVDASKTRDLLGWHPVVSMEEQLRKMARDDSRT